MHPRRHVNLFLIAALISALALSATPPRPAHAATILRITETGLTSGTCGVDWTTGACSLQNALSQAVSGDEIWVAAGTYTPSASGDRTATFQLKTGVALYGGFAGTEALRSERDWAANVTTLSGDIGTLGDVVDNSYHVVTGSGVDAAAVLDGFTITGGKANGGSSGQKIGGGLTTDGGSPTLTNVTFSANSATNGGGGMFNTEGSPTLTNVTFSGNSATNGGGIYNSSTSSPTLTNVIFSGNSASSNGGGMYIPAPGSATLTNVIFSGNTATNGGGIYNSASSVMLTHVTLSGNSATNGGGIYNGGFYGSPTLANSILWGNTASSGAQIYENSGYSVSATYSDIQGGWGGAGNLDADPLFVDADGADNVAGTADDNLRLHSGSPAVDAGSNAAVPAGVTTDLDGALRITNIVVDMGAYEYHPWYVNDDGAAGNGCMSWSDACPDLQTALGRAAAGDEIWVAVGTYTPSVSGDRTATFQLQSGVAVYGGFVGTEALRSERDWATNVTVLSGDIGTLGVVTDNSYHVVTGSGADATVMLDGFTITGGNADGSAPHDSGGGMTTSAGSPTLTNVVFRNNAAVYGGGMYIDSASNPTLTNVTFSGNSAASLGGGMYTSDSNPTLTNVTLSGNSATSHGGGIYNNSGSTTLANSILWGNSAGAGGAQIYEEGASTVTADYSDIQGGWNGTGNIDADPLFVDADGADDVAGTADDNLRLRGRSSAIDAGNNAAVPAGVTTDLDGAPRISNGVVDMGAYEYQPWLWYVNDDGAAGNGCMSWSDACPDLQIALGQAVAGDEIWVAAGMYTPSVSGDRTATFQLQSGVAVYGGFAGIETLRSERDWATNVTVLSGDIGTPNDVTDNSYHVVTGSGADATAMLDGFTVTGGNADGSAPDNSGGGMYNSGGSPTLTNVSFSGNSATSFGGGMNNDSASSPMLTNVIFSGNSADQGGGTFNEAASSPTLTNVTFSGNSATSFGGGIYNNAGSLTLANSILWGNTAGSGGAQIYDFGASPVTATYSDIQGGWGGTGNLDADPLFVDADGADNLAGTADDNLRLQPGSPAINTGNNAAVPAGVTTDLDGALRITNIVVDMGAYEYHPWYVNDDGAAGNGCMSWSDACPDLQTALGRAVAGDEIWVAVGTYAPSASGDRAATFQLKSGVALYGGFAGTEALRSERDWATYVTVLSGDIGTLGVVTDNSYHVVTGSDADATAVLDGFTITGGNADGSAPDNSGGGMYTSGGSPTLINLTVSGNSAEQGGGIYNDGSGNPALTNVAFSGNSADEGGGVWNSDGNPALINVTLSGNSATYGGGIYSSSGSPVLANSILWGNSASSGAQVYEEGASAVTATYSDIQGGWSGAGNLDADPLFVDADGADDISGTTDDNLRLQPGSPAVDAGSNAAVPAGVTTDLNGAPRISNGVVDMGAHEHHHWYVNDDGAAGNGCFSWSDACPDLRTALSRAGDSDEIWVAAGTYTPSASGDRAATFQLKSGVALYGGFAGTEMLRSQRDWVTNVTILSGDIGTSGNVADNSYHVATGSGADASAVLDGFTIIGGNANGSAPHNSGGGMCNAAGNPTVTNVTFSGNAAQYGGGMNAQDNSSPSLTNVIFSDNSADFGGGIYNDSSSPTLIDTTFSNNDASLGGGIYDNSSSPTLTNVTLTGNYAAVGGGMLNYGSSPTLMQVTFSGNAANQSGGGMRNEANSNPTLTNVTFRGNMVQFGDGGGMANYSSSPTLTNVTFSGNFTMWWGNGGGIYNNSSNPTLTNVTFSGNNGEDNGGGMANYSSSPTLANVTFSGNLAGQNGGAIYNSTSTPTLANGILWGNTAYSSGAQIYNVSSAPSIAYSDIQDAFDASNVWDANLGTDGGGNRDADPLFVDNLRLATSSPAIDMGNNDRLPADTADLDGDGDTTEPVPFDLDGNLRIVNDTVDMGAYEYQIPPPAPVVIASRSGNNVLLTLAYVSADISYQVWRSSSPYFAPVDEGTDLGDICTNNGITVTCTHENAVGDPSVNSFYVVRASYANGAYADSNRTGVFGFALAPGD